MSVVDRLSRIDWDFPSTGTDVHSVHSVHWFPGNFIHQIPSALVEVLSKPGELVFDPFGGSGTTAVEASRLQRRSILSDRISACVLIARGKAAIQGGALKRNVRDRIAASLTWRYRCFSDAFGARGEGSDPQLKDWFAPGTLGQLRYIWQLIEAERSNVRSALTLLFSDLLFACASPGKSTTATGNRRRHHWGWVADNVRPTKLLEHDAIGLFEQRLFAIGDDISAPAENILVLQQDARSLAIRSDSIDLVVTSPPYVSVIDYAKANRLVYTWMGWDLSADIRAELGARSKRQRAKAVDEYLHDMRLCWQELHRVLRKGAFCAIVIGESRRHPAAAERTIDDLAKTLKRVWGPVRRNPTRRRVSDRLARESFEFLHIFQKS